MSSLLKRLDLPIVIWFLAAHAVALAAPFYFFSWGAVGAAAILYVVTGLFGITLGYHRLLTHRSLKVPRWLERTFAVCGALSLQHGPIEWVAQHRLHHADTDGDSDPHDSRRGFWWSHIGWLLVKHPDGFDAPMLRRFARDAASDPFLAALSSRWVQVGLQAALAAALFAVGGIDYVVWGIFVRIVALYHATWFVNSAAHMWGYRTFASDDRARNCWWVALLVFGEGWHNNHHDRPDAARAGYRWWELDMTWAAIRGLELVGLARGVKRRAGEDPGRLIARVQRTSLRKEMPCEDRGPKKRRSPAARALRLGTSP